MNREKPAYKKSHLNHRRNESAAVGRKVLIGLSVIAVIIFSVAAWSWILQAKYNRERAAWKTSALLRLTGLSANSGVISNELERLKIGIKGKDPEWTGENVLLMTNGQYVVYTFRHGFNNGFVDHLFLAKSSDGRWMYSTYHFCNHMTGVMAEDPPGSIAEFANRYAVRDFDGQSDECLQKTWPLKK